MKAHLEFLPKAQVSWQFLLRELDSIPFEWHFHPEYELTLSINSVGKRYIGDHIEEYTDNDLTLIGPNLPHTWHSQDKIDSNKPISVIVLWFSNHWIDNVVALFPELNSLKEKLNQAHQGAQFSEDIARRLRPRFLEMIQANDARKLTLLLEVLVCLQSEPHKALASSKFHSQHTNASQQRRLSQVLRWIHDSFADNISLADAAKVSAMSSSHFVRFFKANMHQSFNQYLNEVRIGHACSLLISSEQPVAIISEKSGFLNQSNFNRQFKKFKHLSPLQFRKQWRNKAS
ncbi:helix-turn-helix domain-containing protein [Marinomonas sp. RSW2]|uniref:Helix-turn-helix domain-containing protein n=1 Tax=Marinomonas maritima TaxID=2940935 RepID=A0ABT5WDW0_9GAMM|nr:helix-turn-helix domain-containing protein [Marinomonas maritima]MDE8603006.1 helix-turn-helix domain-containing protein [Marinomonas maritima]